MADSIDTLKLDNTKPSLYVFAGVYKNVDQTDRMEQQHCLGYHVGMVCPGRNVGQPNPYVYHGEPEATAAFRLCQHHSHIYAVSDDRTALIRVRESFEANNVPAPDRIELNEANQQRLREAIAAKGLE